MRSFWISALLLTSLAPALSAATVVLRAPVEVSVMGFKAALDDGRIILTWRRYKRNDFASYQLLKSADAAPQYPDTAALLSSDAVDTLRYEDGKIAVGTWHYRLCIVTRFGDRWVSPVVTVVVRPEDLKRAVPTEADFE